VERVRRPEGVPLQDEVLKMQTTTQYDALAEAVSILRKARMEVANVLPVWEIVQDAHNYIAAQLKAELHADSTSTR